jgi:hypothetical protein
MQAMLKKLIQLERLSEWARKMTNGVNGQVAAARLGTVD